MTQPDLRLGGRSAGAGWPLLIRAFHAAPARAASLRWAVCFGLAVALGGCFGGGEPLPSSRPGDVLEPNAERLENWAEALGDAKTQNEHRTVLEGILRGAGVAPLADRRVPGGTGTFSLGTSLAGWVPGRHPVRRDSLVVVVAPREAGADLALAEAVRMLVSRGAYTQTPERSVLVVLGTDAAPAARLWNRSLVHAALAVGTGPDSLAGVRVEYVPPADPVGLAATLYNRLVRLTTPISGSPGALR